MTVGVKFCGGCNPRYNRKALLQKLQQCAPHASFCPAGTCEEMDILLVLQGCHAACASLVGLTPKAGVIVVKNPQDFEAARQRLCQPGKGSKQ